MKGPFSIYSYAILLLSGFLLFTSCGLRYTPPPSEETIESDRRLALENQLRISYGTLQKKYIPLNYGELTVEKPRSYRKLDSLYAIKYNQRESGYLSDDLEAEIEQQRLKVYADTNPILYVETHWFELRQDSTAEFIVAEVSMTKDNIIKKVSHLDFFEAEGALILFARKYFLEDYFIDYSSGFQGEELNFYDVFKGKAATLSGDEKQQFLNHTFSIMKLARTWKTLSTETLLKQLTLARLQKEHPQQQFSGQSLTVNEMVSDSPKGPVFSHYEVLYYLDGFPDFPGAFKYDLYLRAL